MHCLQGALAARLHDCNSITLLHCRVAAFLPWSACCATTPTRLQLSWLLLFCATWPCRTQPTGLPSRMRAACSPCFACCQWDRTSWSTLLAARHVWGHHVVMYRCLRGHPALLSVGRDSHIGCQACQGIILQCRPAHCFQMARGSLRAHTFSCLRQAQSAGALCSMEDVQGSHA